MNRYIFIMHKLPVSFGVLILSFLITLESNSQTKTNLDVLYTLSDSLVSRICRDLPDGTKEISLSLTLGQVYSVFSNRIKQGFIANRNKLNANLMSDLIVPEINIVIDNAGVKYLDIERDGWFGEYLSPRTLYISGNYLNSLSGKGLEDFYIAVTDTVRVDEINLLENDSFPFTKGELPPEPFLSSLIEPVIAIGVAAVSIILFFTLRSK